LSATKCGKSQGTTGSVGIRQRRPVLPATRDRADFGYEEGILIGIRAPKDFWGGVLLIVVGGGAFWIALGYTMGTASEMGPGYFPRVLGGILVALGIATMVNGLRGREGARVGGWPWKGIALVLGSVITFGLLAPKYGIVAASVILIFGSGFAAHEVNVKWLALSAVLLAALAAAVFVFLLGVELPIWPWSWT
jgi:hypothetical protein